MTRIRDARESDLPWLVSQCRAFSEFFGTKTPLFPTADYAETVLRGLIAQGPFYVAEQDAGSVAVQAVGFIAGLLAPHPLNPAIRVLSELFWWVDPAYRNGRAGALLLRAFEDYGHQNADWIHFTLEAKSPVNPATLERRGFHLHERAYLKEVA